MGRDSRPVSLASGFFSIWQDARAEVHGVVWFTGPFGCNEKIQIQVFRARGRKACPARWLLTAKCSLTLRYFPVKIVGGKPGCGCCAAATLAAVDLAKYQSCARSPGLRR